MTLQSHKILNLQNKIVGTETLSSIVIFSNKGEQ